MRRIENFFEYTDKFLIGDLKSIIDAPKEDGGLGYTCMLVILSGMELIGKIHSGKEDEQAFFDFCTEMGEVNSIYSSKSLQKLLRNSVRNYIAHKFLVGKGVSIGFNDLNPSLIIVENQVLINAKTFFEDFYKTYRRLKLEMLAVDDYEDRINKLLGKLDIEEYKVITFLNELEKRHDLSHHVMGQHIDANIKTYTTTDSISTQTMAESEEHSKGMSQSLADILGSNPDKE